MRNVSLVEEKLQMISKVIRKTYKTVILFFAVAILALLCAYNASSTACFINWEHTAYVDDSVKKQILLIIFVCAILIKFKESKSYERLTKKVQDDTSFIQIRFVLLATIFAGCTVWILSTQFVPGVDEWAVQDITSRAIRGDFSDFQSMAYMDQYPNQWGLFIVSYIIALLFGAQNYLILQIFIAFAITIVFKELSEITALLGVGRIGQLVVIGVGILYIPFPIYSIMVYGNMIGVAMALTAVKYELRYFQKSTFDDAIKCGICIAFGILFKSNMEIYFLALLFTASIELFYTPRNALKLIVVLIAAFLLQSVGIKLIISWLTGCTPNQHIPATAWVAMGLQDGDLAPGWWNSYTVNSYYECGGDVALHSLVVKSNIVESIRAFIQNPSYAVEFFSKKILSTWANPSFQCFGTIRNGSYVYTPVWVRFILSYHGQYYIGIYLNAFCFVLYFGALLDMLFAKMGNLEHLILPMVFVGGFIFYLFWETKARYGLMFFVALLPHSIRGYSLLISKLTDNPITITTIPRKLSKLIRNAPLRFAAAALVALFFCGIYGTKYSYLLKQDTATYYDYVANSGWQEKTEFIGK